MTPLDVRAPDAGLGAGSTKPCSSKRHESAPGFDDAFNAAAGGPSTAAKEDKSAVDGQEGVRSSGKKELSWDPRMKDEGNAASGKDGAAAKGAAEAALTTRKDNPVPPGAVDGADGAGNDPGSGKEGKKDDDKVTAVALPLMTTGPNAVQIPTAKGADGKPGPHAASAWAAGKAAALSGQAAPKSEVTAGRLEQESRRPLVARVGEDQAKGGSSALTALGSRLAELGGDETGGAGKGVAKGEGARDGIAKAEISMQEKPASGHLSRPHDDHTAAAKTDTANSLAVLRLPGAPLAAGRNISAIAAGIAGSPAWSQALASGGAAAVLRSAAAGPVNMLRIQLHPADLGVVTATLRLTGGQLAINLKVETAAAYRQLSVDSRAIVDKLKGHGYAVESITVQHLAVDRPAAPQPPQAAGFANPQAGGQAMAGGGGRPFEHGNGGNGNGGGAHASDGQAASARETVSPAGSAYRSPGGLYV